MFKRVVQFANGKFAIRRFSVYGWEFWDQKGMYWWPKKYAQSYCLYDKYEDALADFNDSSDIGTVVTTTNKGG